MVEHRESSVDEADDERLEALASLYDEHAAAVHACARLMCGSAQADEITRLVFVDAWRRSRRLDRRGGSMRTQLTVAVYRHAEIRSRRAAHPSRRARRRPSPAVPERGPESATVDATDGVSDSGLLSSSERYVLALVLIGRCTYRDVARLLGEPEHTIVIHLTSALHRLRSPLVLPVQGPHRAR